MRTEVDWNRAPHCCVCGSRTPVVIKDAALTARVNWRVKQYASWEEEIVGDVSLLSDWQVYKFCGSSCRDLWAINPLVYEKRVSYLI